MGQKTNPVGLRLKINRTWDSNWYADKKDFGRQVVEDIRLRNFINKRITSDKSYSRVELSDIRFKRFPGMLNVTIHTSRPGMLIGKKGQDIENLKKELEKQIGGKIRVNINIAEIKKLDLDAKVIAQSISKAIIARVPYKRAMKQAISRSMKSGAKGIKIQLSGRLGGSDMARREYFKEGSIPLHTFDADVDYGKFDAKTTYGIIGVSVWVYRGIVKQDKTQTLQMASGSK